MQPYNSFFDRKSGVTFSYPPEYDARTNRNNAVVGVVWDPKTGKADVKGDKIWVSCTPTTQDASLETVCANTMSGLGMEKAKTSLPVDTMIGGADAKMFIALGNEDGVMRKKAIAVAIYRQHIIGIVMHASPESFSDMWYAYKLICDTFFLQK
jgi:hypothetical protein